MKINELPDSVRNALKKAEVKDNTKATKSGQSWLNKRSDIEAVLKGIEHDAEQVALSKGMFNLEPRFLKGDKTYYLWPANGNFVPCGHFTIFGLKSALAQTEDDE